MAKKDELLQRYRNLPFEQKKRVDAWVEGLFKSGNIDAELQQKSNGELADLLINYIWADMDMFSAKSVLISEVAERLRAKRNNENY